MSGGIESPIEGYLDDLVRRLGGGRPRELRYLLSEAETHLRDATAASMAAGFAEYDAEQRAVDQLGSADVLARAELARQRTPLVELARQTVASAGVLAAIGAVAVGISGIVAAVIRAIGGSAAVSDTGSQILTPADCARWLSADPGAHTCRDAAVSDWAAEAVFYRIGLGLIGVLALVVLLVLRRRMTDRPVRMLPPAVVHTVGATAFAVATVWTLALGIDAIVVSSGRGWGQWLSATPVALAGAAACAALLVRDLRRGDEGGVRVRA
jgi:hypothetical protein